MEKNPVVTQVTHPAYLMPRELKLELVNYFKTTIKYTATVHAVRYTATHNINVTNPILRIRIASIPGNVIFVNENENKNGENEKITNSLTKTKTKK